MVAERVLGGEAHVEIDLQEEDTHRGIYSPFK